MSVTEYDGHPTQPWEPYHPCPCGCQVIGWKLKTSKKVCVEGGCVVGCNSPSCRNRRNQKRGKRGEYNRHRQLGGKGWTPTDEMGHVYSIEIVTQDKKGAVIPMNFRRFVASEWARHALSQAERSVPEGVSCYEALYLEPPEGGAWLVVRLPAPRGKAARKEGG